MAPPLPRPATPPPLGLRVFGLQLAGHVKQQVLVVDHLQLSNVRLRLQVGGGRLRIHGYQDRGGGVGGGDVSGCTFTERPAGGDCVSVCVCACACVRVRVCV